MAKNRCSNLLLYFLSNCKNFITREQMYNESVQVCKTDYNGAFYTITSYKQIETTSRLNRLHLPALQSIEWASAPSTDLHVQSLHHQVHKTELLHISIPN